MGDSKPQLTGIPSADSFIGVAHTMGLLVEVTSIVEPESYLGDGRVQTPAQTVVSARITIAVPDSLVASKVVLAEANETLYMYWSRFHVPTQRGRWISGNHVAMGTHEDMHTVGRATARLTEMASRGERLTRLATR